MECNGLYVSNEHLSYLQGVDSPIWNRITEIKHHLLQESPEVLEFRRRYSHKLTSKTTVAYDDLWAEDSGPAEIVDLDIKRKPTAMLFTLIF
jgi:hypothetical protein